MNNKKENHNAHLSGKESIAFQREAIAYALGHFECWVEQFAKGIGLSQETVTDGIFNALANQRNRTDLSVQQVRSDSPVPSEVLQPALEVASGTRERVQVPEQEAQPVKRRRYFVSNILKKRIAVYYKTHTIEDSAKHFKVSPSTVTRYGKGE